MAKLEFSKLLSSVRFRYPAPLLKVFYGLMVKYTFGERWNYSKVSGYWTRLSLSSFGECDVSVEAN